MKSLAFIILLLVIAPCVRAADVAAILSDVDARIQWKGDETIEVILTKAGGLLNQPVNILVDGTPLTFNGFHASFNNCSSDGWTVVSQHTKVENNHVLIDQQLKHPALKTVTNAAFDVWMSPDDKTIRFKIAMSGEGQHLDELGIRPFTPGFQCSRMYFAMSVVNGPVQGFDLIVKDDPAKARGMNRYWAMELDNGLTLLQATDMVPTAFHFAPGKQDAVASISTYCSSPIVYSFVVTKKGGQEALTQFSRSLGNKPSAALNKMPGRCTVIASYPINGHLQSWYKEFVGRGARDLIWMSFADQPNDADAKTLAESNSLYVPYTNYVDYFDKDSDPIEGQIPSPDWKQENCILNVWGLPVRGYKKSTRLLPDLYTAWAEKGQLQDGFYNLKDYRDICGAKGFYFDVHAALYPSHYFDSMWRHHSQAEFLKHTGELFSMARTYADNGPILSEWGGEWLAGSMDGGAFLVLHDADSFGIKGSSAEWYPNLDQVHRRHHLPVSTGDFSRWPEKEWENAGSAFQRRVALNILFGRSELIHCYWNADLRRMDSRLMSYYLNSAFHRMLGLEGIKKITFAEGDIHRPIVEYDHGATAHVNLSEGEWTVDGYRLAQFGYLIKGPDFLQYSAIPPGKTTAAEFVRSPSYWLMASASTFDFGAGKLAGAYAVRQTGPNRLAVYEIVKPPPQERRSGEPSTVTLRLPDLLGRSGPFKLKAIYNVFADRRMNRFEGSDQPAPLSVKRPVHWPNYQIEPTRIVGDELTFAPAQDPACLSYDIEFESR